MPLEFHADIFGGQVIEVGKGALFASAELARAYILAGHAMITLVSRKTGVRFTYKITKKKGGDVYFVALLSGPDNTADYRYLGILNENSPVRRTAKSKITAEAMSYQAIFWAWNLLMSNHLPSSLEVWHEGTCGRCGRLLTVPESIASGLGPICAEKG